MRYMVYFLVYVMIVFSMFITFLYLMTKVDPGLLDIPEKAAKMIAKNQERAQHNQHKIVLYILHNLKRASETMQPTAWLYLFTFSAVMIILFPIMVYLMTTVNPEPIVAVSVKDNSVTNSSRKFDNVFLNDAMAPAIEQFVLDKMDADEYPYIHYHPTRAVTHKYNNIDNFTDIYKFTRRKIIPPLWPRPTQSIVIDPTMHIILHSMWQNSLEKIDTMSSTSSEKIEVVTPPTSKPVVNNFVTHTASITNNSIKSQTNKIIVKSMKRRSVNNYNLDKNSGSIILKILDNDSKSRIEIKLGPDMLIKKQKAKNMSIMGKKSKHTIQSELHDQHENINPSKDTIISIMPNDSIVIDEFDGNSVPDREHMDIKDLISSMISIDENNEGHREFLSYEDSMSHNGNYTESFSNIVANSSNFDIRNNTHMNGSISFESIKNDTDFETMANTKINNTEFNKILFGEEEPIKTDSKVLMRQGNHTALIHNAVASNYTDVFAENENDLVIY